jgi:hypothetical protein
MSPTIQQLLVLSQLSGYRLSDWLAVFGFSLDEIPGLQASLDSPRTKLLETTVYNDGVIIPWLQDREPPSVLPPVVPLSRVLEFRGSLRLSSLLELNRDGYRYAKIGWRDAFAFPDLFPGSVVRVNSRITEQIAREPVEVSRSLFLVQHCRGFSCCRLHFGAKQRITLLSIELPFANVELQLPSQGKILGVVDLEFRPLASCRSSATCESFPGEVAPALRKLWTPVVLEQRPSKPRARVVLRSARDRSGLSFRQASDMSRAIAQALGDKRYFLSAGSLSDLEAKDSPPRHIHKLISICILYSLRFVELLKSFGLEVGQSGQAAIPDRWLPPGNDRLSERKQAIEIVETAPNGFLAAARRRLGDAPFLLRNVFASLSGLAKISLRDVFWLDRPQKPMHPSLSGALLVIVNRRKRKARLFHRKSVWEQPLYLLQKRDGSYLLASCSLENGTIVVHPNAEDFVPTERLRNHVDVEIVGQIVSVLRSVS